MSKTYTEVMMDAFKGMQDPKFADMVEPTEEFINLKCMSTTIGYCIATGRVFAEDVFDWDKIAEIFPKIKQQNGPSVNTSRLVDEVNKQWNGARLVRE